MNMTDIKESIEGLQSGNDRIRFRHFKMLLKISENNPKLLYPYWDVFVSLLRKEDVSNKYYAIFLIANTIKADSENRFEKIFKEFYKLLDHESPVVSSNIAGVSGRIANAKPELVSRITKKLLNADKTTKARYPDLMKSYIIKAFDEYFEKVGNIKAGNKKEVIKFVKEQTESTSPKTKKAAKEFLRKRDAN